MTKVMTGSLVSLDLQDQLVNLDQLDLQEREVLQEWQDLRDDRERKEQRARLVLRVHRVRQVLLDPKVLLASLVLKDCEEYLAQ